MVQYVFQDSELINLLMGIVTVLIFIYVFKRPEKIKFNLIYTGFVFIVCGYVFTVIEGIIWKEFFNLLEHLSYALSGAAFAAGSWSILKQSKNMDSGSEEQ